MKNPEIKHIKEIKKITEAILKGKCSLSLPGQYDVLNEALEIYEGEEDYEKCADIYVRLCEPDMTQIKLDIRKAFKESTDL